MDEASINEGRGEFRKLKSYLFRDKIAESDVGTVYRGYDQAGGGPVVVKVGRSGYAELRVAPEVLPRVAHPQIVRTRDAFTSPEGDVVLVQDPPTGRTVAEARGSYDGQYRQIAHFIREAAIILAQAHEAGVTHGDISERTLLIGEDDLPHFSEFGMGLRTGSLGGEIPGGKLNGTGDAGRERKLKLDERADLFALGGVLYFMLSGQRVSEQPMALLSDPHAPIDDIAAIDIIAPEAPPDLRAICSQALATDPVHRYLHADQLVADLEAYLFGKRSRRWVKLAFAVVGAAMVGLFGLWGFTGGGAARIVAASAEVRRGGDSATDFKALADADQAMGTADGVRIAMQASKPTRTSVFYRDSTGAVSLLGSGGDARDRNLTMMLPSGGAESAWRLPAGQGLIVVVTHHKPVDARAIESALLPLGDPPRSYAPIAWFGESLGVSQEPPIIPPANGGIVRYRTYRAYAQQAAKALDEHVDDAALALVYVVGV